MSFSPGARYPGVSSGEWEGVSFVGRRLPPEFALRLVTVAPGAVHAYVAAEWRGALVVVEEGEVELECHSGVRHRCARGDVLWLSGLPLRALHNRGPGAAVLSAVSRRSTPHPYPADA